MSFNLTALAKTDTTNIHLIHPETDEKLYADEDKTEPVMIVVYGTSSKQYRNKVLEMNNARIKLGKKVPTAETLEASAVDLLVACSKEAINLDLDGEPINTPEAFRKLYSNPAFDWLRTQVDEGIGSDANFLPK